MGILSRKKCTKCGEWKNKSEFQKDKTTKDGFSTWCKVCRVEKDKRYRLANVDKIKARKRAYYLSNVKRAVEKAKQWKVANWDKYKESLAKSKLKYRANNLEKIRESDREYKRRLLRENPEKAREHPRNRRAWRLGNGGTITNDEWMSLKKAYGFTCLKCKKKEPEITLSPDHVIPLSLGGVNSINNIQPLCRSCNISKGAKTIDYR